MQHLYNINFAVSTGSSKDFFSHFIQELLPALRQEFSGVEIRAYRLTDPIYDESVCNCSLQFTFPDEATRDAVMASQVLADRIRSVSRTFEKNLVSFDSLLEEISLEETK
ncbi:MAG: hypothetical protein SPI72_06780 [Porphyromonas sp.]|nr:hypothetical protein [Porphyromonas sp.]